MELLVQACNLLNAINLNKIGVKTVIVGEEKFASRLPGNLFIDDLKALKQKKINFHVLVNNLFMESEIENLIEYLKKLSMLNVPAVIFHDYAVLQINKELNLNLNLIYHSETMVTSHGQLNFFESNNVKRVCLARELFLPEIKQIIDKNPTSVELEIQVHGLMFMMQSKWNLLNNYREYLENRTLNISQNSNFMIREETRNMGNFIYEDRNGTHMFTGYELCTIEILDKIQNTGIKFIRIDCAMKNQEWIENVASIYCDAISNLKNNNYTKELITIWHQKLSENAKKVPLAQGFFGGPKTNPHFQREVSN